MISYPEARARIKEAGEKRVLGEEAIALDNIVGRIAAKDVTAPLANQPFDNSAMDGFALAASELAGASKDTPLALEIAGRIAAGSPPPSDGPGPAQCYEIMTGAPLPPGCDAVVPVEKTEKKDGKALFQNAPPKGDNIRRAGEDFAVGDILVKEGQTLQPGHVMILATAGVSEITVRQQPKTGLISTGTEVISDLSQSLKPGQIYNSSAPYLQAQLKKESLPFISYGTVSDDTALFTAKLEQALAEGCDIIVSTGAVSAGVYDFVPAVLKEMGAEILFHKVAIRPGKPILFARFSEEGPYYLGLPGNPVSTAVGWRFFGRPLVRTLLGLPPEVPHNAILANNHPKRKANLRFFLRGRLKHNQEVCEVELPQPQQSFMASPFGATNVWVMLPEGEEKAEAGQTVDVFTDFI